MPTAIRKTAMRLLPMQPFPPRQLSGAALTVCQAPLIFAAR